MNDLEDRIATGLHSLADRPHPPAPVDDLVTRGRRAKRHRRTAFGVTTTAGVVATATAGTLVFAGGTGPAPRPGPMTEEVTLASAVATTTSTTFKVQATFTLRQRGTRDHVETYRGAFDAPHDRGYLRGPLAEPKHIELRFIGDETFLWRGKWQKVENGFGGLARGTLVPGELTTDPIGMLKRLSSAGKVGLVSRSGQGPDAVATYSFSYAPAPVGNGSPTGARITGRVIVAGKHVRRVEQSTTVKNADPDIADKNPVRFSSVIELSGYGAPVKITRP